MATRLMVCAPGHYDVRYAINPWMTRNVGDATPDAQRQWDRFIELAGCVGDVGFATTFLQPTYFEGAGDALFDRVRPLLYAGYGWRTERGATMQLQEIVGCRVLPLLLVDERFYHLDTALCPLSSGHVMAYMDAFSPHAQTLLRRAIEPGYLIEVSIDDALRFACNAVEIGDAVIVHETSRRLRERLHDAGYRVFATDLSEFHKAGGSAKCLTLRLDDGPALAISSATA